MITWVLYLCIGIVVGGMAGFYFAKLDDFSKKQKQELEDKLQKSEQELVEYKDQVTAHFIETANLINNMTESYQKVHEHLANGSVELCNNAIEVNKLTVSTNQLPSSAARGELPDAEEVTSLAESEAPKTDKVDNNNNKPKNEAARIPDDDSPESSAAESPVSASADSNNPAKSAPLDSTADESDTTFTPEEIPAASIEKTATSEPATIADNPVIETMAVADEEDSSANTKDDDTSKNPIPGSRMVH